MSHSETLDPLFSDLMHQAQGGDSASYEQLLLTIAPLMRTFISRRVSNQEDVDDIVQNSLLAVHHASHTYNTERSFTGWMFAIVRHKLNDFLRSHYRQSDLVDHSVDGEDIVATYSVTNLPTSSEDLLEVINDLPERQRHIVTMLKIEGYSIQEVARRFNMSESAVKVSAHRAPDFLPQQQN